MKNWTVADAVATINAGKDTAGIREITTHFPEFALAAARNDLAAVAAMMPEKMTLRRLQLSAAEAEAEDYGDEEEAEAPKVSGKGKAAESADDGDYSSMTKDQLIELCVEKGLKVAKHQKPKQYYIDALNAAGDDEEEEASKKSSKVVPMKKKAEAEDDAEDDEYAGKTAKELFNMCKERGIKVQPKQASRVYIEALKAADAEDDGDDEDWSDEDDTEEEAPKKPEKTSGKSGKKTNKKEEDDEEDWDI